MKGNDRGGEGGEDERGRGEGEVRGRRQEEKKCVESWEEERGGGEEMDKEI